MRWRAVGVLCLLLLAGCAGMRGLENSEPSVAGLASDRSAVVKTAYRFIGTPYRYGGATPEGFDCSGYVAYVYAAAVGLSLPHYTGAQIEQGRPVATRDLLPADLVFFRMGGRIPLHVGIYLGDRRFIHAPSRDGAVSIERLDHPYWKRRYRTARRLLPSGGEKGKGRVAVLSRRSSIDSFKER